MIINKFCFIIDNKKYTKPIVYNNFKREDSYQTNAWGSNYTRKINSDIGSNNSYKVSYIVVKFRFI